MTTLLWFLLGITATLAVVLGVIVLTGDDDTGGTAATTSAGETTVTGAPTTSAVETTVTTAGGTTAATGTTAAPACPGPGATTPAIGPGVTVYNGDFDGDGATDRLIGYQAGDGTQRIQMALSYGYATEMQVVGPAVALAAQRFAEGDAWLGLAQVDTGASTGVIRWFQLDGCTMVGSTLDGAGEASFILGGSVTHGDGMVCNPDSFTANQASTNDFINWEYYSWTYQWDPVARTFHSLGVASSTLVSPANDAEISTAYDLVCPFSP
jgi:hypothetical protein